MDEEVTQSWLGRLKDAFLGIFVGFAMIIGAIILIFWNERHSLHMAQSLEQTQKILIPVAQAPVSPQNNLKVIYFSGLATTPDQLTDPILGISLTAINLDRKVTMYQWQEEKKTKNESQMGGSEKQITTYSYHKIWSDKLIDSTQFKNESTHQNPSLMPLQSLILYAEHVTVGDFSLPDTLIKQINVSQPVNLDKVNLNALEKRFKKPIALTDNELYLGPEPQKAQVGDMRISLSVAKAQEVSIIAQQVDKTVQSYQPPAGEPIMLLSTGHVSSTQMIHDALSENKLWTWVFRVISWLVLIGGFSLIMKPLVIFADFIPFLASIVGVGTGIISFILGSGVWIVVIAIAWFATRPFLAIGLIILACGGLYLLVQAKNVPKR